MLNIRHVLLILPLFFFLAPKAFGQDEEKSIELRKILDEIALQHKVKFNYAEEDIKGRYIFPPKKALPLRAKLIYIANRTGLGYKEIGTDYVALFAITKKEGRNLCAHLTDEFVQPVDNAVIQTPDKKTIVTGTDGYFEIPRDVTGKIYIGHLGYQPVIMDLTTFDDDCKEIILKLEVTELEGIVTDRYLATGISKKQDGSFAIRPRKFGILPGLIEPDVLQAMQQLPGINSIDETVSNINVRGGTHDQNLFMWNGIRLFQTGHFFGLISALNPNLAHDIRISKNGTSAFYGESVSSAVDISSRPKDIGNGNSGVASNMIGVDFYTKIKSSEKANFELSARRSFTDVIDLPTYSRYSRRIFQNTIVTELDNSTDVNYKSDKEFYFYDFTGQYHQKIGERHDLYTDVIGISNSLDFTQGTITATNVVTEMSSLDQLTLGGALGWRTEWNDTHSSEAGLYASYYNVDGTSAALESSQVMQQGNTILDAGFRFSDSNRVSSHFNIHSGYQFNEIGIENSDRVSEPAYSRTVKEVLRTHALIGEAEYDSESTKLHSRLGIRANYIEQLGMFYLEPRLQLNYKIVPAWQLEVLAELKSQSATQVVELQGDFLGLEKRRWILANDKNIPVQKSRQVSVGVTYKDSGWLVSLENFYKKVKGITTSGQAFQDQLELRNDTGSYTVFGTEFLVQKQFSDFYAWLSYSWNNNNYSFETFSDRDFPSNFEISHTINTAAIYEWHNLKIALGSKWFTGRPVTTPLSREPVFFNPGTPQIAYTFPNSGNIGNYMQVNFSASYQWKLTERIALQLSLSVLNIFNRQNIINRYYRISNDNERIEVVNTYALQRTPNALVKLTF